MVPGHHYRIFRADGGEMSPTIPRGYRMIVDTSAYADSMPRDSDVVLFWMPLRRIKHPAAARVLAGPHDRLVVSHGIVRVNGRVVKLPRETFVRDVTVHDRNLYVRDEPINRNHADVPSTEYWPYPDRLPEDCYYVAFDDELVVAGSNYFGCVQMSGWIYSGPLAGSRARGVVGKVVKIYDS